jgi:hypothetical protein
MKFTQRELPVAPGAAPAPRIEEATTALEGTRAPSACAVDFFEAHDRLPPGFEESSIEIEINKARKVAAHRLHSAQRVARFEESLYWLLSAATLVYLLLRIIGA